MLATVDWDTARQVVTIFIALISFGVAIFTLYITQYKSADIKMSLARNIRIGGTGGGGFQLYMPITLANNSHRPGSIVRIIVIFVTQTSKRYLFELSRISELDMDGKTFIDVGIPSSLPVLGKTSIQNIFRFVWWNDTLPKFELEGWENEIIVCAWTRSREKPDIFCRSKFSIGGSTYEKLKSFPSSSALYEVSISGTGLKNSVLDDKQFSKLLP